MLAIRGGVLQGRTMTADEVESLAKLPPIDVLRGQVLGAIIAPLSSLIGLVSAPLQNLEGLIDARIEQLEARSDTSPPRWQPAEEPAAEETEGGDRAPGGAGGRPVAEEEPTAADAPASASDDVSTENEEA